MVDVTLNNVFLLSCMILGVVLSLWVGLRYVIAVDRNVKEILERVKGMEQKELDILGRKRLGRKRRK